MLAGNLRTAALPQAVQRTFDGQHPCRLCKAIAEGKKAERSKTFTVQKLEFISLPSVCLLGPRVPFSLLRASHCRLNSRANAPPSPPPRKILV
jgi:hypothetical protein